MMLAALAILTMCNIVQANVIACYSFDDGLSSLDSDANSTAADAVTNGNTGFSGSGDNVFLRSPFTGADLPSALASTV